MHGPCRLAIPIIENKSLHLASSSPRRSEILASLGLKFSVGSTDVDEQRLDGEPADAMVLRLARDKALSAAADADTVVIAADTAVVLGGDIFGKPKDKADALQMLARLSGRTHRVLTGVAVHSSLGLASSLSTTDVRFREVSPDEALAYWQSGEPCDKAGAYAIQGTGGIFVEAISGSYSGVVGLPVFETALLLRDAGLRIVG